LLATSLLLGGAGIHPDLPRAPGTNDVEQVGRLADFKSLG